MTSSKSFRASFLPSSFSVLRTNSDPSTPAASSTNDSRKKWHKSNTIVLSHMRDSDDSESSHDHHAVQHESSDADPSHGHKSRKSKLWGSRISSLLPTMKSPSSDPSSSTPPPAPTTAPPPIPRNVVESSTSQSSPTSTINDSVSTPSLRVTEPPLSLADEFENSLGIQNQNNQETKQDPPPQIALPESDIPAISMSLTNPEINAIPPSPEMKRATLQKDPPTETSTQISPPESTGGDSQKSGKLQKSKPESRRRSDSLQHTRQDSSVQNLKTRQTSPKSEARGRRSVSAQSPSAKRKSGSGTRITSTPLNARPMSSHGDPSQSPTRGRLRRSWLPGGGRSRSNSIEVSNASNVAAWVMSDDTQAEYNATFLKNAEKVGESVS